MGLFSRQNIREYVSDIDESIKREIISQSGDYILNVNIDDYTNYIYEKNEIDIPQLKFDEVFVDTNEKDIPKNKFPRGDFFFYDDEYGTIKKQVIIYHIPYEGKINLLELISGFKNLNDVTIDNYKKCIIIEVINFYDKPEKIKNKFEEKLNYLKTYYQNLKDSLNSYNQSLKPAIKNLIESRKQQLLKQNNFLASLGVPIKEKSNVPTTFSIPKPKLKEKITIKPIVHQKKFKPEPALDEKDYNKILKIINDIGKNFERLPSTYKGKSEEDIRDHIILILDPNFELGSVTGETFNKIGKTDICLRYDSSVVFISECKYWKGEKVFIKTIDQLLGYLTWRNSKVAIINFVQNKEFTDVLEKIKTIIKTHSNYLKELGNSDETWFNYKFHLNGDRNREIALAVISFHLPK